jgi:hypothetical protein
LSCDRTPDQARLTARIIRRSAISGFKSGALNGTILGKVDLASLIEGDDLQAVRKRLIKNWASSPWGNRAIPRFRYSRPRFIAGGWAKDWRKPLGAGHLPCRQHNHSQCRTRAARSVAGGHGPIFSGARAGWRRSGSSRISSPCRGKWVHRQNAAGVGVCAGICLFWSEFVLAVAKEVILRLSLQAPPGKQVRWHRTGRPRPIILFRIENSQLTTAL